MATGEAEPLQYTTTVLRVSIHCEGCKKKVKKVLQSIEGVYKVTIDAAQNKVTVTGSVGADALVRRLLKSGKQAALWPVPAAAAAEAKKPEAAEVAAPSAGKSGKGVAEKAGPEPETKVAAAAMEAEPETLEKKLNKEKGSEQKAEAKKPKDKGEVAEKKEKDSPPAAAEPAKAAAAAVHEEDETAPGGKKGNKKKTSKQKDAAGEEKPPQAQPKQKPQPQPKQGMPVAAPERAHGAGLPYYAAAPAPVMSYHVAHPSAASVSYYAPTQVMAVPPFPPPPPQVSYGYAPYPYPPAPMLMAPPPPPEFVYGPPGIRASPPRESYDNAFNEENPNSCSLM